MKYKVYRRQYLPGGKYGVTLTRPVEVGCYTSEAEAEAWIEAFRKTSNMSYVYEMKCVKEKGNPCRTNAARHHFYSWSGNREIV